MTTHLAKSSSGLPHSRNPRLKEKKLLFRTIFVLTASLLVTVSLVLWMLHSIKHSQPVNVEFTLNL